MLYGMLRALYRAIYRIIPFKNQLIHLLRNAGVRSSMVTSHLPLGVHLGSNTILNVEIADTKIRVRSHDLPLENRIFWEGLGRGWEKDSLDLWMRLCKSADIVIDVGANIGLYSLAAKVSNMSVEVHAFEPVKMNHQIMEENCQLNHFDVQCHQAALSNTNGYGYIQYSSINDADRAYLTCDEGLSRSNTREKTRILRLDAFIAEQKITKIDVVKIDVERHEKEVLEGFGKYLNKMRPALLIEILDDKIGCQVQRIVQDCGYLFFNIDEKGMITKVSRIIKSSLFNYLLCSNAKAREIGLL